MLSVSKSQTTPSADHQHFWTYVRAKRPSKHWRAVLSVDGGGLRGIIPAIILAGLEVAIKEYILCHKDSPDGSRLDLEIFVLAEGGQEGLDSDPFNPKNARPDLLDKLRRETVGNLCHTYNFDILLEDYLDLSAGTSTGAIIATYLASRGKYCSKMTKTLSEHVGLREKLTQMLPELFPSTKQRAPLWPGGIQALIATFVGRAAEIFPPAVSRTWESTLSSFGPWLSNPLAAARTWPTQDAQSGTTIRLGSAQLTANLNALDPNAKPEQPGILKQIWQFLFGACKYKPEGAALVFMEAFGGTTRLSSIAGNLLVNTFDLGTTSPVSFYCERSGRFSDCGYAIPASDASTPLTFMGAGRNEYIVPFSTKRTDPLLWEVVMASVSAPTYMPVHVIKDETKDKTMDKKELQLIDGGVAANNPSLQAAAFAAVRLADANGDGLKEVAVLSLGTGKASKSTVVQPAAGTREWLQPNKGNIVGLVMDGNTTATEQVVDWLWNEVSGGAARKLPTFYRINHVNPNGTVDADQAEQLKASAALKVFDVCQHVPDLAKIGWQLLGNNNDERARNPLTNMEILQQYTKEFIFGKYIPAQDSAASASGSSSIDRVEALQLKMNSTPTEIMLESLFEEETRLKASQDQIKKMRQRLARREALSK